MKLLNQAHARAALTAENVVARTPPLRRRLGLPRIMEPSTTRWFRANREELEAAGVRFTPLPDPRLRQTPLPRCLGGTPPAAWSTYATWKPHERYYLELPRGRVAFEPWRCAAAVFTPGGSILHDAVSMFFHPMPAHPVRRSVFFSKPHRLPGRALLLFNDATSNFFHWMCDILPRLHVAQCAGRGLAELDWFVTDEISQSFHRETLAAVGIPMEKVVVGTEHRLIEADMLCVASLFDRSGVVHRESLSFVREALLRHFGLSDASEPGRRFFISRERSGSRRITNWSEIEPLVTGHGFEIVRCEDLSMREQVALFHDAAHIIAGHGAGLTNLMFCRPGTRVLEILNESWAHPMYWLMAEKFGLDYTLLHAEALGKRAAEIDDLCVDPAPLRAYLEGIG